MDPDQWLRLTSSVFTHAFDAIMITDSRGVLVAVNPAFTRITGYARDEVVGRNPRLLRSGLQDRSFYAEMWRSLKQCGVWQGEIINRRRDGGTFVALLSVSAVRDQSGRPTHYVGIFTDFTDFRESRLQLERLAYHDPLTGLPNRTLLMDRMHQSLARADRDGSLVAVCYVDIDGFKAVNDTHGHDIGDKTLVEASGRMKQAVRGGDTVARIGGDEFVILLTDLGDRKAAEDILSRLGCLLAEPLSGAPALWVTASVGVTLYPPDRQTPETLLRHADQAMYEAKNRGRNTFWFYTG